MSSMLSSALRIITVASTVLLTDAAALEPTARCPGDMPSIPDDPFHSEWVRTSPGHFQYQKSQDPIFLADECRHYKMHRKSLQHRGCIMGIWPPASVGVLAYAEQQRRGKPAPGSSHDDLKKQFIDLENNEQIQNQMAEEALALAFKGLSYKEIGRALYCKCMALPVPETVAAKPYYAQLCTTP